MTFMIGVFSSFAESTFSSAWYQGANGAWYIYGPNGQTVANAWVCDNGASAPGSENFWYLIDAGGNMVTSPLVQDGTGHFYSLETNHNGHYGMLRYVSGNYDGINLTFSTAHDGSFGAILNPDGIQALQAKYGLYSVAHINNSNCIYTGTYAKGSNVSPSPNNNNNNTYTTYTINYYVDGSKYASREKQNSRSFTVIDYRQSISDFLYWEEASTGDRYYPGDEYYFEGNKRSTKLNAVFSNYYDETYTVDFMIVDSLYKRKTSSSGSVTVPANPGRYQGMPFLYWADDYGNHWSANETYTAHSSYDVLYAVYDPFEDGVNGDDGF